METINVQIKVRGNCTKEDVEAWIATCFCFPQDAEDHGITEYSWIVEDE